MLVTSYYTPQVKVSQKRNKAYPESISIPIIGTVYCKYSDKFDATLKLEGCIAIEYKGHTYYVNQYGKTKILSVTPKASGNKTLEPYKSAAAERQYRGKTAVINGHSFDVIDSGSAFEKDATKIDLYVGSFTKEDYKKNHQFKYYTRVVFK